MSEQISHIISVPSGLLDKIMSRIDVEQKKLARRNFILSLVVLLIVLAAVVPVWKLFYSEVSQSGFAQYLAFGLYDFNLVISEWQDFSLSLLESLPTVSTIELFVLVFVLLSTLKFIVKYSKDVFINTHHFISNP